MSRYVSIVCSVVFVGLVVLPFQVSAASITEKSAAIGEGCVASGPNATAIGLGSIASADISTSIGRECKARGVGSIAMGGFAEVLGYWSIAMGAGVRISSDANFATLIGYGFDENHFIENDVEKSFMVAYMGSETDTSPDFFVMDGAVGIGTKTPRHLLDLGYTLGKKLAVYQGPDGNSFYGFGISDYTLEIYAGADVQDGPAMVVKKPFGLVGIGTANPSYKLHVMGNAAGISWTNLSSRAYKEDIQMVDKAAYPMMLSKLINMELATYKYKKEYGGDGVTKLGFIAEEMPQEVLSKDGKGVDLYELLALTIGAVKAHQKETDELKAENEVLRQEIRQIKAALGM